jgi:tRNA-dihydrouridine synthase B
MKKRMRAVLADRGTPPPASPAGPWPLREGFAIGGVPLANRVVQAPLAGIANWAFRRQSRRHGAGLAVSEMVASFGVHHGNRRTLDMLRIVPDEHPVGVQLFGSEPEVMAEAARAAEEAGADLVDINMGCPVPKVCKTGAGAALLDDLPRAEAIVRAMVAAVDVPVTVKMRRGLRAEDAEPVEAARRLEAAGAAAIFVHPRAAVERYEGLADHRVTARVAAAVEVPVVASGDITTPARAREVVEQTGCAAVAVGRAALGDPWAYGRMATGVDAPRPPLSEVVAEIRGFARDLTVALGDERRAAHYLRKFYPWYLVGRDVPAGEMETLVTAPDLASALARLDALAAAPAAA